MMDILVSVIVPIIISLIASSGVWALVEKKTSRASAEAEMLLGLGHREIMKLCDEYISRGYITLTEFEDLEKYLFNPYVKLGGNGTAEMALNKVKQLPIRSDVDDNGC